MYYSLFDIYYDIHVARLARYLREIRYAFDSDPKVYKRMKNRLELESSVDSVISKAFRQTTNIRSITDPMTGSNVFGALMSLYNRIGSEKQPYMAYALFLLNHCNDSDTVVAKLSEICDRANRCESAVRQGFNILISASVTLMEETKKKQDGGEESLSPQNLSSVVGALQRLQDCFEDYLDDHKEKAFNSAIVQPARFYFDLVGDRGGRDHVNIHGMNWYLAVLHATLGVQLPILPKYRLDKLVLCYLYVSVISLKCLEQRPR